jgi:manganese transport protein
MTSSPPVAPRSSEPGWRRSRVAPSLAEVYRSVPVHDTSTWRKMLAFAGPGYLVAVGYMDPGNWATDLAGGSQFGYTLLSVILLSNLMAVLLQGLASKLGIVTGRDLAQACRDHYSKPVGFVLWILCELAIAACDLAEVIGTAIALNLLFGIPLAVGVAITALDVLLLLYLQNKGFRVRGDGGHVLRVRAAAFPARDRPGNARVHSRCRDPQESEHALRRGGDSGSDGDAA